MIEIARLARRIAELVGCDNVTAIEPDTGVVWLTFDHARRVKVQLKALERDVTLETLAQACAQALAYGVDVAVEDRGS